MVPQDITITKKDVMQMNRDCFDKSSSYSNTNMRERHIYMGLPEHQGFVLAEGNTNGWLIVGTHAGLNEAISWLNNC